MLIPEAKSIVMEHHLPDHIIRHCEKVRKIVQLIGEKYAEKGVKIDLENLISAALLHDLFRIADIPDESYQNLHAAAVKYDQVTWDSIRNRYKGKTHAQAAYDFFMLKGEEKLALMIKKHYFFAILDPIDKPTTLEEKILSYADKRVMHDKIVSLKERFEEGSQRHNPNHENMDGIQKIYDAYYSLEKELLEPINLKPEDIKE